MDIGYVAPALYPFVKGGAEKRIYEIGKRLAERDHDVTIYSRHWWEGPKRMDYAGMNLHAVGPSASLYAGSNRRSVREALGFALRTLPSVSRTSHDIIATPVAPYLHVPISRFGGIIQRTPLVVTWHEVWGDYWLRYMGPSGRVGDVIERTVGKIHHHPVTPSEMTADRLAGIGPPREEIKVIPNGVDLSAIRNVSMVQDGFDVLYVGRLIEDKNVGLLLGAFDQVGGDATLGIIGEGPLREELEEQAAGLEKSENITFLGALDTHEEVIGHMKTAPIFVSASIREGFGMTLLEAMAAGCTVITVDHRYSAAKEVVDGAGIITEPNVQAIGRALDRALSGHEPDRDPSKVAEAYDWENIATRTEEFYLDLV